MLAALAAHLPDAALSDVKASAHPSSLARERALARIALVPWLPANTVEEVIAEVLRLAPRDRIGVLADLVEHIAPDLLLAVGNYITTAISEFLESGGYDRYVVESGFRALSRVLSRTPSMELEDRALTLARSTRLSPVGHIFMLMQLASASGRSRHAVRALTLAFDIAGDHEKLVASVAEGLSPAHMPTLAAVLQQDGGHLLKPDLNAALATVLGGESPFSPHIENAFSRIEYLRDGKFAAELPEVAPWLDATQIERSLTFLEEETYGRTRALSALFKRAAVLGDVHLVEMVMDRITDSSGLADAIRDAAKDLPTGALPLALARVKGNDSATAALAIRAARLGAIEPLTLALDRLNWANEMDAIEEVYRVAPDPLIDMLVTRADAARPPDRARALAQVIARIGPLRRETLVNEVVRDAFGLRVAQNSERLRILQTLEPELSTLPPQVLATLWAEAMRSGVEVSRAETMVDIRGFVRALVSQFGASVATELDDAIRIGGRDEWP
jgi:hypothetical protein